MKTNAQRQATKRQKKVEAGLTRLELWVKPGWHKAVKGYAAVLNGLRSDPPTVFITDPNGLE